VQPQASEWPLAKTSDRGPASNEIKSNLEQWALHSSYQTRITHVEPTQWPTDKNTCCSIRRLARTSPRERPRARERLQGGRGRGSARESATRRGVQLDYRQQACAPFLPNAGSTGNCSKGFGAGAALLFSPSVFWPSIRQSTSTWTFGSVAFESHSGLLLVVSRILQRTRSFSPKIPLKSKGY